MLNKKILAIFSLLFTLSFSSNANDDAPFEMEDLTGATLISGNVVSDTGASGDVIIYGDVNQGVTIGTNTVVFVFGRMQGNVNYTGPNESHKHLFVLDPASRPTIQQARNFASAFASSRIYSIKSILNSSAPQEIKRSILQRYDINVEEGLHPAEAAFIAIEMAIATTERLKTEHEKRKQATQQHI